MLYERYQRALKAYNAVDFDDLIMTPVLLFKQQPEILAKWQAPHSLPASRRISGHQPSPVRTGENTGQ